MRIRVIAAGLALALTYAACAPNHAPSTLIGVRKVSLSVAFSDEALKPPPKGQQYTEVLLPLGGLDVVKFALPPLPKLPAFDLCPKAEDGATPDVPATSNIVAPPEAGTYLKRNFGTVKVNGALPITLPYPLITQVIISHVQTVVADDVYYGKEPITTFESEEQLAPGLSVKDYYSYNPRELDLVKEEVITNGEVTTFAPVPAIQVLPFTGPGNTWAGGGVDPDTKTTATVQGEIAGARELIDVCGKIVDTLKVSTTETRAALADQAVSGSGNPDHPNVPIVQNYAPQFGGLVVRREEHSQRTLKTDSAPVTLQVDVISTLLSIKPMGLSFL
jgi:hypothetical protein